MSEDPEIKERPTKISRRDLFKLPKKAWDWSKQEIDAEKLPEPTRRFLTEKSGKPWTRKKFLVRSTEAALGALIFGISRTERGRSNFRVMKDTAVLAAEGAKYRGYRGELQFILETSALFGEARLTETERSQTTASLERVIPVIQEVFGSPGPWNQDRTMIFIKDVGGTAGSYAGGQISGEEISNIFRLPLIKNLDIVVLPQELFTDPDPVFDNILIHELTHQWDGEGISSNTNLGEGLAMMSILIYAERINQSKEYYSLLEKVTRINHQRYAAYNSPEIAEYDANSQDKNEATKAYVLAGLALLSWYRDNPAFFKQWREKRAEFFKKNGGEPDMQGLIRMGEEVRPGFEDWFSRQYIFQKH